MERAQTDHIRQDLLKKIVFIVGPRQVGKTWLARHVGKEYKHVIYLNEDHAEDREMIRGEQWPQETDLIILDELHKMPGWKNYLKGVYDTKPEHLHILVTGSARLDTFRRGGDALSGRFFAHRLLPFSISELKERKIPSLLERLLKRGGFPEPFLSKNEIDSQRWRKQYVDGLIRTDVLDFERVHDLRAIQTILELLRFRVGSPVSYASLARDVGISPTTAKRYIDILEALYIIFRVPPYSRSIARSILKEPKIYFFDTGLVDEKNGSRLENLVAVSLLKHCYAIEDMEGVPCRLHFLRTKDGKEVDFCVVRDNVIKQIIEVKSGRRAIDPSLRYFCEKYDFPGLQLVQHLRVERKVGSIEVRNAGDWLANLMP